jgi:hypothetical protein
VIRFRHATKDLVSSVTPFASQTYSCDDLKLPLDYRALSDDRQVTQVAFFDLSLPEHYAVLALLASI